MSNSIQSRAAKIMLNIESCCLSGTKFKQEHLEKQLEDFLIESINDLTNGYQYIWQHIDTSQTAPKTNDNIAIIALDALEKYAPQKKLC